MAILPMTFLPMAFLPIVHLVSRTDGENNVGIIWVFKVGSQTDGVLSVLSFIV